MANGAKPGMTAAQIEHYEEIFAFLQRALPVEHFAFALIIADTDRGKVNTISNCSERLALIKWVAEYDVAWSVTRDVTPEQ